MTEQVTAADRLSRILYLLPAAAREGGVAIAELAAALGVSEQEVMEDVTEVTAREFYHPAGWVAEIGIEVGRERIRVRTAEAFRRPVRLSPREALALGLGLRALAAEAEPARRAELLALAARLEAALAAPEMGPRAAVEDEGGAVVYEARGPRAWPPERPPRRRAPVRAQRPARSRDLDRFAAVLADDEEDILSVIVEAARARRECRVRYLKPGAAAPEDRLLRPYHLVHAEGRWYVLAHSVERGDVRIFRIDRMLEAELGAGAFDVPPGFDPAKYVAQGGRLFVAEDDVEVAVRYSRRIARWIEERVACKRREDGSVVVRHRVADARWIVRHVLQYGADAEVLEPAEVRGLVREAARRMSG